MKSYENNVFLPFLQLFGIKHVIVRKKCIILQRKQIHGKMRDFETEKAKEMVLHILNVTGGADFYHIVKILYFAEMKHLARYGVGFVPGGFSALEYGPVPMDVYELLNHCSESDPYKKLSGVAKNIFTAKRDADLDYLSEAEIESIDESIKENVSLSFYALLKKSHDEAWTAAGKSGKLSPILIAKVGGASEGMLEFVEEQMEIDMALS